MANPLLQHYIKLTEFLGQALGPDYEVALHDLTDKNRSIIAIANNHVSGREIGAPLTNVALKILMDKSYETQDYRLHYPGVSAAGKTLRSSTLFIKQHGKLFRNKSSNSFLSQSALLCPGTSCHWILFRYSVHPRCFNENK